VKFLLWFAIAFFVVMWLQHEKKARMRADAAPQPDPNATNKKGEAEAMVQCAHCGIHVPASEALVDSTGARYCSEQHRHQHGAR